MNFIRIPFFTFAGLASLGFLASLTLHLASLANWTYLIPDSFEPVIGLHVGIFCIGLPFFLLFMFTAIRNNNTEAYSHISKSTPKSLKRAVLAIFIYAMVFMVYNSFKLKNNESTDIPVDVATSWFTSVQMFAYAGLAVLYFSIAKAGSIYYRCSCRKICSTKDNFCRDCGSALSDS